jgi:hypothetical protein
MGGSGGSELQIRRLERVPVDIPEHHSVLADRAPRGGSYAVLRPAPAWGP